MKKYRNHFIKKTLCGFMAAVMVFALPSSALAAEDGSYQNAPVITATPTPDPHTQYYNQAPDTDSIKEWPAGPKIEGESAVLMDMTTGAVLYSKNADKIQYPASITKIMTALLACEHLDMNGKLVMSESAAYGITVSDSSSIYADTGEEFTMEQAMMAVMLQSANEMTLALAENTSGSVKKFVELIFRTRCIIPLPPTWRRLPGQLFIIPPSAVTLPEDIMRSRLPTSSGKPGIF